jgi:hypothetical protein
LGQVLISYAREERDRAARLADCLEADGWEVWWDLHLTAGSTFDEEIDRRLQQAQAVVVLWSRASVASRWVTAEAEVAAERQVLVPARLEDVEIPLPFRRLHAADLEGWRGGPDHPGLDQIRSALTRLSGAGEQPGRGTEPARKTTLAPRATSRRPWRDWRVWLGFAVLVAVIVVGLLLIAGQRATTETVVVPDVIGMRLDEALLELSRLGIFGPGFRQTTGEPFPDDSPELDTLSRVEDVSPPPGSRVPGDEPDLTLYLELCDGPCQPLTTPQGLPSDE